MPDLFPILDTPIPQIAPDVPWTGLLVWLALSPRIDGATLDATASISYLPYRVLRDGTIDQAPEAMKQNYNIGSALEAMQTNPRLGQAIAGIAAILSQMMSGIMDANGG